MRREWREWTWKTGVQAVGRGSRGSVSSPKVREQPHPQFSLVFPGFLINPSLSPPCCTPWAGKHQERLSRAQNSFPGHSRHQKEIQNIASSSSCWIKPGSFSLQSSPYLEAAPSLLPSPCSTCEINVCFCAQLLPAPHVLPGKMKSCVYSKRLY